MRGSQLVSSPAARGRENGGGYTGGGNRDWGGGLWLPRRLLEAVARRVAREDRLSFRLLCRGRAEAGGSPKAGADMRSEMSMIRNFSDKCSMNSFSRGSSGCPEIGP